MIGLAWLTLLVVGMTLLVVGLGSVLLAALFHLREGWSPPTSPAQCQRVLERARELRRWNRPR